MKSAANNATLSEFGKAIGAGARTLSRLSAANSA